MKDSQQTWRRYVLGGVAIGAIGALLLIYLAGEFYGPNDPADRSDEFVPLLARGEAFSKTSEMWNGPFPLPSNDDETSLEGFVALHTYIYLARNPTATDDEVFNAFSDATLAGSFEKVTPQAADELVSDAYREVFGHPPTNADMTDLRLITRDIEARPLSPIADAELCTWLENQFVRTGDFADLDPAGVGSVLLYATAVFGTPETFERFTACLPSG